MSSHFQIGAHSAQGLGARIRSGDVQLSKLALVMEGAGRFTLIDIDKDPLPSDKPILRGEGLHKLMRSVANGVSLDEKEYQVLTTDPKFRSLCRLVPGLETNEHRAQRGRASQALERAFSSAKLIGKGSLAIERQGYEARYVGQDQGEHPYWIREVVLSDSAKSQREVDLLISGWEQDKSTALSLKEWEQEKRNEWKNLKPGQDFLDWIVTNSWKAKEQAAWEKEHPGQKFDEMQLSSWKDADPDPDLFLPIWLLKSFSGAKTETDFQKWKVGVIDERKEHFEKFKKETGLTDLSFEDHEKLEFAHSLTGSIENPSRWILRQAWNKARTHPDHPIKDDFTTFVRRLQYQNEHAGKIVESDFRKWSADQENRLHLRHEGSKLPLTFEQWKAEQDDGLLIDPAPFILLDENQRKPYATRCVEGRLERNGHPFNTEFDKTRHSGAGYAIFVIGPDLSLYAGSHIGGVFHHSSFLGEGATIAAGEVKTAPDGTLIELSSKSGHYQPQEPQSLFMLRYFRDRGVDLASIKFTSFSPEGKTVERNALEYLNELETGGISAIDPQIFH